MNIPDGIPESSDSGCFFKDVRMVRKPHGCGTRTAQARCANRTGAVLLKIRYFKNRGADVTPGRFVRCTD